MSESYVREYICDLLMKSVVIGHQQKTGQIYSEGEKTKKAFNLIIFFYGIFHITGSYDR